MIVERGKSIYIHLIESIGKGNPFVLGPSNEIFSIKNKKKKKLLMNIELFLS